MARENTETIENFEEIAEIIRKSKIIVKCESNRINGIIDKDLIEERNQLVHASNSVITAYISPKLFKTIDNLRGGITRSAFCRMAISDFCTVIQENGIIDKDTIEERNQIVYSSDPIISSWVSIEILTTIDNLRGKRSRSEFFRMAVNEFCEAIIEIGSTSCNSGKSPNLDPITKPKKTGGYHVN
jgi:hypothetical protein